MGGDSEGKVCKKIVQSKKKLKPCAFKKRKKEMVESILCMSQWDDGDLRWVASPSIGNSGGPNRL